MLHAPCHLEQAIYRDVLGLLVEGEAEVAGFLTWGITRLIDVLSDKKQKIAGPRIG